MSSIRFTGKMVTLALISSTLIATGCASKKPKTSDVYVSPISYNQNAGYTGGPLVDNHGNIQDAAAKLASTVHFDYNSDVIKPEAAAILQQHAALLGTHKDARVLVAGHTDERGSREYNMSLGERRAAAVRAFLEQNGANGGSIEIISYGEEQPVATGHNEASWSQNRRAVLSY